MPESVQTIVALFAEEVKRVLGKENGMIMSFFLFYPKKRGITKKGSVCRENVSVNSFQRERQKNRRYYC